jgi:hypothetical protein
MFKSGKYTIISALTVFIVVVIIIIPALHGGG